VGEVGELRRHDEFSPARVGRPLVRRIRRLLAAIQLRRRDGVLGQTTAGGARTGLVQEIAHQLVECCGVPGVLWRNRRCPVHPRPSSG